MQTIQPSKEYVFIEKEEANPEGKTKSGILIPNSAVEQLNIGTIINKGANVEDMYQPKDKIFYKPYAVTEVKVNDKPYYLVNQEDIIGKIVDASQEQA